MAPWLNENRERAATCPWAPWTFDSAAAFLRSFEVLVRGEQGDAYAKALCHCARVKLHKVRRCLAGERVSALARRQIDVILRNAAWEREYGTPRAPTPPAPA